MNELRTQNVSRKAKASGFRSKWRTRLAPYPAPVRATGFTLIELSIVLVIIGLITGGVLVGQDLIEAAKLRTVISEQEEIKTAMNTFRLKYNCMAGDCDKASQFGLGLDGNGDKSIGQVSPSGEFELCSFWSHMSAAGLLNYTPHKLPVSYRLNCLPLSNFNQESVVVFVGNRHNLAVFHKRGESIHIGQLRGDEYHAQGGGFEIAQAKTIDSKIDDGIANSGKVFGVSRSITSGPKNCSQSYTHPTGSDYRTITDGSRCHLVFWLD